MYAIMFVLDNPNILDKVLEAWKDAGISGVTIIESTGIHKRTIQKQHIPMRFQYAPLSVGVEEGNITLFTVIHDKEMIQVCEKATESVVGNLEQPDTGILFAWPLEYVKGVPNDSRMD
jgi:nitrogen regulatory protein PII